MKRWKLLVGILATVLILFVMVFSIYRRSVAPYVYLSNSYKAVSRMADADSPEPISLKAHIELTVGVKVISSYSVKADVKYFKPDKFFIATEGKLGNFTVVSDDRDTWLYLPKKGVVFHGIDNLPVWRIEMGATRPVESGSGVVKPASSTPGGTRAILKVDVNKLMSDYSPAMTSMSFAGETVRSITLTPKSPGTSVPTLKFYISESDLLPRMVTVDYGEGKTRAEVVLSDVVVGSGVSDQDFIFQPSEGTEVRDIPREQLLKSLKAIPEVIPEML